MGTNFFLVGKPDSVADEDPEFHIGKRSAAGYYCWDCQLTLCKGGLRSGEGGIHDSESEWYESCPACGNKPQKATLREGSVGVELGFAQPDLPDKRTGVRSVSSFSWAMNSKRLRGRRKVIDEYERTYTMREFRENVLDKCPIWFHHLIGQWFS